MDGTEIELLRERLKTQAITAPKIAREEVLTMLTERPREAAAFLDSIDNPGDGRLRHLVAEAVRNSPSVETVRSRLEAWRKNEPDEFTKRAIDGVLEDRRMRTAKRAHRQNEVEVFQYLSSRMKHEVRNGLSHPRSAIHALKSHVAEVKNPTLQEALLNQVAALERGLQQVGRLLELQEGDEEHFQIRPVILRDWLARMHRQYISTYSAVGVSVVGDAVVHGSDYLLRRVFWNVWQNAHRILGTTCEIHIAMKPSGRFTLVEVSDNGDGFQREQAESMFRMNVSGSHARGEGLLEVAEAMQRLGGTAEPHVDESGKNRMLLTFRGVKR